MYYTCIVHPVPGTIYNALAVICSRPCRLTGVSASARASHSTLQATRGLFDVLNGLALIAVLARWAGMDASARFHFDVVQVRKKMIYIYIYICIFV